jgi:GH15 family glucan-1,4-alpha-glucosidase
LEEWLSQCTYKGQVARDGRAVGPRAEANDLLADGRDRRCADLQSAESIGGGRNWDYRYTWLRDAAFTSMVSCGSASRLRPRLSCIGSKHVAPSRCPTGSLQLVYRIDGSHDLAEEELTHLDGYRSSRPVRIGNGAADQLQLDVYGELLDSVYLFNKYGTPISDSLWKDLRRLVNWVCDHWQEPDEGIWETRGGRQHFVYSKLMCWVQ